MHVYIFLNAFLSKYVGLAWWPTCPFSLARNQVQISLSHFIAFYLEKAKSHFPHWKCRKPTAPINYSFITGSTGIGLMKRRGPGWIDEKILGLGHKLFFVKEGSPWIGWAGSPIQWLDCWLNWFNVGSTYFRATIVNQTRPSSGRCFNRSNQLVQPGF